MPEAMTVSPVPNENPDGSVSYHFQVDHHANRVRQIEQFEAEQDRYVHTDEYGNQNHMFALENPEVSRALEPDNEEPIYFGDEQDVSEADAAFFEATLDFVGGEETFNAMTRYARQNWTSDEVENFNHMMDAGNYEQKEILVRYLQMKYHQHYTQE